jgi:hypothetical protein
MGRAVHLCSVLISGDERDSRIPCVVVHFFLQESGYSSGPPARCPDLKGNKNSVSHYGFGEIMNDRCTNPTLVPLLRYLKDQ